MLYHLWMTIGELAPWLLLGMFLAGLMHLWVNPSWIHRHFRGPRGVLQAVLLGIPLPLCSCGVIPAGIGLKKDGASDGAAVGFLISTPQTGVDSILVSAAFLGWPFAIFKMFTAFASGLLGGLLAEWFDRGKMAKRELPVNQPTTVGSLPVIVKTSGGATEPVRPARRWSDAVSHAVEILRSIWGWLVFGIIVSAFLSWSEPSGLVAPLREWGMWANMGLVLIISLPLYVCATASVPIAAALIQVGFSPAAAFVFLMAGPASNVTTLGAIYGQLGRRNLIIYLATIVGCSFVFGAAFEWWFGASVIEAIATAKSHHHEHGHGNHWLTTAASIVLIAMLVWFAGESCWRIWRKWTRSRAIEGPQQTLPVSGMHCGACVAKLETALLRHPQVAQVSVQLEPGQVSVVGSISAEQLRQVIREAGYAPDSL